VNSIVSIAQAVVENDVASMASTRSGKGSLPPSGPSDQPEPTIPEAPTSGRPGKGFLLPIPTADNRLVIASDAPRARVIAAPVVVVSVVGALVLLGGGLAIAHGLGLGSSRSTNSSQPTPSVTAAATTTPTAPPTATPTPSATQPQPGTCQGSWTYASGTLTVSVITLGPADVTFFGVARGSTIPVAATAHLDAGQNQASVSMTLPAPPTNVLASVMELGSDGHPTGATVHCSLVQQGG